MLHLLTMFQLPLVPLGAPRKPKLSRASLGTVLGKPASLYSRVTYMARDFPPAQDRVAEEPHLCAPQLRLGQAGTAREREKAGSWSRSHPAGCPDRQEKELHSKAGGHLNTFLHNLSAQGVPPHRWRPQAVPHVCRSSSPMCQLLQSTGASLCYVGSIVPKPPGAPGLAHIISASSGPQVSSPSASQELRTQRGPPHSPCMHQGQPYRNERQKRAGQGGAPKPQLPSGLQAMGLIAGATEGNPEWSPSPSQTLYIPHYLWFACASTRPVPVTHENGFILYSTPGQELLVLPLFDRWEMEAQKI